MTVLWEHRLIWQDYVIEVRHTCGWSGMTGFDHLNITVLSPERAAIPITETGYKSHFLDEREIILAGGAVAYVTAWLDQASQSPEWQEHVRQSRQLSLF